VSGGVPWGVAGRHKHGVEVRGSGAGLAVGRGGRGVPFKAGACGLAARHPACSLQRGEGVTRGHFGHIKTARAGGEGLAGGGESGMCTIGKSGFSRAVRWIIGPVSLIILDHNLRRPDLVRGDGFCLLGHGVNS